MEFSIKIQGDSEGYVTFECPFCGSEFKLQAGEYQDEDIPIEDLFCPYCGLTKAKQDFLSEEVLEEVQAIAQNYLVEQLNASFKKMSKTLNRSKGAFGKCVLRLFGLQLLASFITFVLIFIIAFACGFGSAIAGQQSDNNTTLLMIVSTISSLIAVFIFGISAVYSVDISAQYLRSVFVKKKPKPIVNNQ